MKITNIAKTPGYGANFSATQNNNANVVSNAKMNNVMCPVRDVLVDKNYGVLQTRPMNVSFKGGAPVKQFNKVSKNVNNLFNIVKANDLIVTAPSYKVAVDSLKENVNNIKTVIKRIFYVEEPKLDQAIGFRKNLGEREAINLGKNPLIIKDSKNQSGFLKEGEAGYLLDGDTVNAGKHEILIQEHEETVLPIKDSFTFFVDLDKEVEPKIKEINEKSLAKINMGEAEKPKERKIMFSDVGGMDGTIKELKKTILYPMKYPELKTGRNMNKSVLLYGPPGTGKSYVAEACANEAGAWYKKINASQLDSKWVGESEENWTNLFNEARENQPAIIFIDEIDAIGKKRGGVDTFGDKTLNTILGLMSDSEKRGDDIYVIAATNKRNLLDDALTRSGRIGKAIEVPKPDLKGTEDILNIYTANEKMDKAFDKAGMVKKLHDNEATGSDIASITEEAKKFAFDRANVYENIENGTYKPGSAANLEINNEDFEQAIEAFNKNKQTNNRKPIGFTSELYK